LNVPGLVSVSEENVSNSLLLILKINPLLRSLHTPKTKEDKRRRSQESQIRESSSGWYQVHHKTENIFNSRRLTSQLFFHAIKSPSFFICFIEH
jgi:5-hydroxyisourate hydrolase-like protein (transthyretin family)